MLYINDKVYFTAKHRLPKKAGAIPPRYLDPIVEMRRRYGSRRDALSLGVFDNYTRLISFGKARELAALKEEKFSS